MMHAFRIFMACALLAGLSAGCATAPVSNDVKAGAFRSKAKTPQNFWLTVYDSARGPVVSGGHRLHPNQSVAMPFLSPRKSELPLISVQLLREDIYTALVDTSAGESWAEIDDALAMDIVPLGPPDIFREPLHLRNAGRGMLALAETLRFDQLYVENALIFTRLEDAPGDIGRGLKPNLVLGGDFLKQFRYFQINWPGRTVAFSATHPYRPNPDRLLAELPLRRLNGACVVEAVIDGKTHWVVLDSAGNYELAMTGAEGPAIRQMTLGNLVLRHVRVTPHADLQIGWPGYPKVGTGILSKVKVTVDNKLGTVYIEKPAN